MISTNKNAGNLQDVKVSTQANTIALRSNNPESVILAIQFASKEGYDTVQSLTQGEVVLSKEGKGVLNVNRVAVGYKKVARGVEVNTSYADYTESFPQEFQQSLDLAVESMIGDGVLSQEDVYAPTDDLEPSEVGELALGGETPSQGLVETPADVLEEEVVSKKVTKSKSKK